MRRFVPLLAAALFVAAPAFAASHDTAGKTAMSEGEVRKVDKDAGKVTIKHGPIANLEMPPMTMVFRVKEPAMLDQVKAEKIDGNYTVTELKPAR